MENQQLQFILVNALLIRILYIINQLLFCGKVNIDIFIVCFSDVVSCSGRQVGCNHLYFIVLKMEHISTTGRGGASTIGSIPIHHIHVGEGDVIGSGNGSNDADDYIILPSSS